MKPQVPPLLNAYLSLVRRLPRVARAKSQQHAGGEAGFASDCTPIYLFSRTTSKMYSSHLLLRSFRDTTSIVPKFTSRFLSASFPRSADGQTGRRHENSDAHGEAQKSKPTNPHLTNTTSTMKNDVPSVGADKAPPELISSVDPEYVPKDDVPENTERMTGGTQPGNPNNVSKADLGVGEMEGAKFKIEPLRRTGEDSTTMRARLLCSFLFQKAP